MFSKLLSVAGALLGMGLFLGLCLMLRSVTPPAAERSMGKEVSFSVAPPPKPPPQKKKPRPKKTRRTKVTPPTPMLNLAMSGLDFGLGTQGLHELAPEKKSLVQGDQKVVMTADTVDLLPRPRKRTAASYPQRARTKGIEGYVVLSLVVDEHGSVHDVVVVESTPEGFFEEAASRSVKGWSFAPGEYEGSAVPVRIRQTIRFQLS